MIRRIMRLPIQFWVYSAIFLVAVFVITALMVSGTLRVAKVTSVAPDANPIHPKMPSLIMTRFFLRGGHF